MGKEVKVSLSRGWPPAEPEPDRTEGLTKIIVDPKSDRVLGVGIVGPEQANDRERVWRSR
jgi:pyruvate/2-oxoglutarate dehydrogenase complex dihydrolipoamide dehydrogenase (E3) component